MVEAGNVPAPDLTGDRWHTLSTHATNCIIIDHFSVFESGLVAPFLYAA
jgi:hypothetical protein